MVSSYFITKFNVHILKLSECKAWFWFCKSNLKYVCDYVSVI